MSTEMASKSTSNRAPCRLSQDSEVLRARLIKVFRDNPDPDHVLTYQELNGLIGGDVSADTTLSSKLTRAMRAVERLLEIKLVRDARSGGVVRARPEHYVTVAQSKHRSIRRQASRLGAEAARLANLSDVANPDRAHLMGIAGLQRTVAAFTGRKVVEKAAIQITRDQYQPLSRNRLLELAKPGK